MHRLRMLCNEVTETAGSGGAVTPAPIQAPANGAAPNGHDIDVAAFVATAKDSPEKRNALFAELRKNGMLGEPKPKTQTAAPAPVAPQPAPSEPVAPADMRKFDKAIARSGVLLTVAQIDRMEALYALEKPSDASEWVNGFIDTWGMRAKPTATATATAPQPVTPTAPTTAVPVTNAGNPPPPQASVEHRDVMSWSRDEINAFITRNGGGMKGLRVFNDLMAAQFSQKRLSLRK